MNHFAAKNKKSGCKEITSVAEVKVDGSVYLGH